MERFARYLLRYQITLVTGSRSRCVRSIASLETRADGSRLLSVNRELFGPWALEAVAYNVGLLLVGERKRRLRLPDKPTAIWDRQRAWWKAAEIAIPDEARHLGRERNWDDFDLTEYYNVTPRLFEARKEVWRMKLGEALAWGPRGYERSTIEVPSFWCEL